MDDTSLYHQIAESIRKDILTGLYKPGDRLPSVRQLCEHWNCTPGTIQRAYNELAREGLLVSRAGRGTQVAGIVPQAKAQAQVTMRKANLVNRMEAVLLESLTAGYDLFEIQQAMELAMDRWRTISALPDAPVVGTLRFAGSHDPVMNDIARDFFGFMMPGVELQLTYNGSLGGLIALAEGKADLAGSHLWDVESDTYNLPFVRRVLPGKEVVLVTLAHRRVGLIVAPGNPQNIRALTDLARPGIRFVNRQSGSGTRVWLDAMLSRMGIQTSSIAGFDDERLTHSDLARAIAGGSADAGLGLETAARAYGLDFVDLIRERYDLVMLAETAAVPVVKQLIDWLGSFEGKQYIDQHQGYESQETGSMLRLE